MRGSICQTKLVSAFDEWKTLLKISVVLFSEVGAC